MTQACYLSSAQGGILPIAQGPARPAKCGAVFAFSNGAWIMAFISNKLERYILRRAFLCTTFRHSPKMS
jgi:hypothetical protein